MAQGYLESDIALIAESLSPQIEKLAGKSILFAGGGGFLGRYFSALFMHLNKHVLEQPCRAVMLDNFISANNEPFEEGEFEHVRFIRHDIIQGYDSDEHFDYVVQAAGIASPYYYRAYPLETIEVSITGTKNLLNIAREHRARFVFFSSSEIYGDPDPKHIPTPESYNGNVSCLGARACYDESKRLGETLCRVYHTQFGVHTNIIRPFNVYGPGMGELDYRVLPNLANRARGGHPFHIYGDGRQSRTFCYISDAITGFMKVLMAGVPGEPYNIGNPSPEISMLDLALLTKRILGIDNAIDVIEYPDSYPADEPNRRCPDITKARKQLAYAPQVSLEEGLTKFYTWTQAHFSGKLV